MAILAIHGGVNTGENESVYSVLRAAAKRGFKYVNEDPLKSVEEAVKVLEDDSQFNAGYGAVLNVLGKVELDAAMMDGRQNLIGSVAAINNFAHPISIARRVLESSSIVFLTGVGANKFALENGFSKEKRVSVKQKKAWEEVKRMPEIKGEKFDPFTGQVQQDTVGCIVLTDDGGSACGTSTGGRFFKPAGRIGDSPIPGAGFYASQRGAVTCSGSGETFIELLMAKQVDCWLQQGFSLDESIKKAISQLEEQNAKGGILGVDNYGNVRKAHNCKNFPVIGICDGEELSL